MHNFGNTNGFSADLKLPRQHPTGVNVAGVCLKRLVVAQDLGGGSGGHGGQKQTVPYTMPENIRGVEWGANEG